MIVAASRGEQTVSARGQNGNIDDNFDVALQYFARSASRSDAEGGSILLATAVIEMATDDARLFDGAYLRCFGVSGLVIGGPGSHVPQAPPTHRGIFLPPPPQPRPSHSGYLAALRIPFAMRAVRM